MGAAANLKRSDAGFTLVEVLVTLSLIAVISGLMLLVVSQFRVLNTKKEELAAEQQRATIIRHINRTLASAEHIPLLGTAPEDKIYFESSENHIRFVAVVRTGAKSLGLREVEFLLRPSADPNEGFDLIERRKMRRPNQTSTSDRMQELVIAEGIEVVGTREMAGIGKRVLLLGQMER